MPRGGARANSGPKKGTVYAPTRAKAEAREAFRRIVDQHMESLLDAQLKHAKGLQYLVARDKRTGKFEKLTADEAEKLLSGDDSDRLVVEVWEKDPSVQAFTDILNRYMDKPADHVELTGKDGGPLVVRWKD